MGRSVRAALAQVALGPSDHTQNKGRGDPPTAWKQALGEPRFVEGGEGVTWGLTTRISPACGANRDQPSSNGRFGRGELTLK